MKRTMLSRGVRTSASAAVAIVLLAGANPSAAHADSPIAPVDATVTVVGAGYGHGIGMSQWGAYGAAKKGLSYSRILAYYYPGTRLSTLPSGNTIRVWITADNDAALHLIPSTGLRLRAGSVTWTLPTGNAYRQWRVTRSGSKRVLKYLDAKGAWVDAKPAVNNTGTWWFENTAGVVSLKLPNGRIQDVRGQLGLGFSGSSARTVNRLSMESYLRSVVPAEMPASWAPAALQAQSVAARTYAARIRAGASSSAAYDICDTTSCQVYKGVRVRTTSGTLATYEASKSDAAIKATSGRVLTSGGKAVLTQFSASNGGVRMPGSASYLKGGSDPYDGVAKDQRWSVALSASKIQSAYRSVGTLRSVTVTRRTGTGRWDGWALDVRIVGTKGSVTVSGTSFRWKFGLRSNLFYVVGGLKSGSPLQSRWAALGGVTGRLGEPLASEEITPTGRSMRFTGGDLYWSANTGARLLTGSVRTAYRSLGGPASELGYPITDASTSGGKTSADFRNGGIECTGANCLDIYG